jgi:serine/threonine protein kinase
MKDASVSSETTLADLVSLWQRRRAEGQPATPAELCRACPELLPEFVRRIAALEQMDNLADNIGETISVASTNASLPSLPGSALSAGRPEIPGFEMLSVLGRGGMGLVYLARDTQLKRLVALKMVLAGPYSSEDSRGRFRAEAEAVARLQHPHVVQVFSWGEYDDFPYFVMEYVAGGGLDHRLAGQPQPPADAARLVMLLARAVHAAHKAGVVHRDLKPANVLLAPAADEPALNTAYGWPKISDFGLARLSGGTREQTASSEVLGTPSYMAPEQAVGKMREIGPRTDIYALGAILYELLTGCPPFKGESLLETLDQVRSLPPRPPRERCADVPLELETICLRCLAKSPEDRPTTAAELAEDLRRFLEGRATASLPSSPVVTTQPKPLPSRYGIAALFLLLAGVGGLTAFLSHHSGVLPETTPKGHQEAAEIAPKQVRVERLTVRLFEANGKPAGVLGEDVFVAHAGDTVRVNARLSRPAFAFLIAFRPQGAPEVCFPENENEPPPQTDKPAYPLPPKGDAYGLDEGTGLEVFALVVSSQPLPAFKEWWARCPNCPWKKEEAPSGVVYRANGEDAVEVFAEGGGDGPRGKGAKVKGETPMADLAAWLRKLPGVETVQALGFAVMPKEKR